MPTLLELLTKASAPPPPQEPRKLPEPLHTIARTAMAIGKALEPAVEFMNAVAQTAERIKQTLQEEPYRSVLEGVAEALRNWPTDPHGRPLELEEYHYGFAAAAAVKTATKAAKGSERAKALDDFLLKGPRWEDQRHKLGLGLRTERAGQLHLWRVALWGLIAEQLKKVMYMLTEFQRAEQAKFLLRPLEGLLPEQERRVLSLKVAHPAWTYRQIASALGISESAVKTYSKRTRDRAQAGEVKELFEGLA